MPISLCPLQIWIHLVGVAAQGSDTAVRNDIPQFRGMIAATASQDLTISAQGK